MAETTAASEARYANRGNAAYTALLAQATAAQRIPWLLGQLQPGLRVLDAGCGPGGITTGLAQAVAPTGEAVGVDVDTEALAVARDLADQRGVSNVRFEEGSIYALPFPDASFDAAYAIAVLFHLQDPLAALRELGRVLKTGGLVGISTLATPVHLYPLTPLLARWRELSARTYQATGVDLGFGPRQRELLLAAGFVEPETRATVDSYGTLRRTRAVATLLETRFHGPNEAGGVAVREGWATADEVAAMAAALHAWGERPDAFAYQVLCHSVARKPS